MLSKGKKTKAKIISINSMLMELVSSERMSAHQILRLNKLVLGMVEEVSKYQGKKFLYKIIYDATKERFTVGQNIDLTIVDMNISLEESYFGSVIEPNGAIKKKYKGEAINGIKLITSKKSTIFGSPHLISERKNVTKPLETGIISIDVFNTMSKGQRLAIVGQSKTGKSYLASSLFINPSKKDKNVFMIYAFIGETHETVAQIREHLAINKSLKRSILLHSNPASKIEQYLSPYIAMAMAENLQKSGKDVIVVLDNLTTHAQVCSEIAILNGRPVGRDVMPGDIFYTHSSILERGGSFKNGGSISVFPLIHVNQDDFSSVIASNIISITDGQILLDKKMATSKKFPAINLGRSISRIGYKTMPPGFVDVAKSISEFYYKYQSIREIYGNAKVTFNPRISKMIDKGESLEALLTFSLKQRNTFNINIEMFFLKFIDWNWNKIFDIKNNLLITSFIWMSMYDSTIKKEMKRITKSDVEWTPLKLYIENVFISIARRASKEGSNIPEWAERTYNDYAIGYNEETLDSLFKWLSKTRDKSNGGWEYDF